MLLARALEPLVTIAVVVDRVRGALGTAGVPRSVIVPLLHITAPSTLSGMNGR